MAEAEYRRLSCAGCSVTFPAPTTRGRPPSKCGECRQAASPRKATGIKRGKIVRTSKPCGYCGKMMPPATEKKQKLHCDIRCANRAKADTTRRAKEVCCLHCGVTFRRRLGGNELRQGKTAPTYCSYRCRDQHRSAEAQAKTAEAKRLAAIVKLARKIATVARRKERQLTHPIPRLPEACTCSVCGTGYLRGRCEPRDICQACLVERQRAARREATRARRKTPSGRAAKSAYKARRRARERIQAEHVDPLAIFARDQWKCRLCGCRTPQRKRGTYDDDAPELDHIISLAEGGHHVPANLQCACRRCNADKGARSLGQLWLWA